MSLPPRRRKAFLINLIGNYASTAITVIQGILLVPLYLRFVGDRLYGLWLASGGVLSWLGFVNIGISGVITQRVSEAYGRRDFALAGSQFVSGIAINIILAALFFGAAAAMTPFVSGWFDALPKEAEPLRIAFMLAAIALSLSMVNNGCVAFIGALHRPLVSNLSLVGCSLAGFIGTAYFLFTGLGLWAIPLGLLIRIIPLLAANLVYSVVLLRNLGGGCQFKRTLFRSYLKLTPSLMLGNSGNSMVDQIEPTIIVFFIGPEVAAAYAITRRVADLIKLLMNSFLSSLYAGFSHLHGEGNQERTVRLFSDVMSIAFGLGLVAFASYIAGNRSFVTLWVGTEQFLGQTVTVLIAIGLFALVFQNYLQQLLKAMGDISGPSLLLFGEAALRTLAMVLLISTFGIIGLPLGMILSCSLFGLLLYARTANLLPLRSFSPSWVYKVSQLTVPLLLMASLAGSYLTMHTWHTFVPYMFIVFGIAVGVVYSANGAIKKMYTVRLPPS